ncbi:ribose 5-phosphate isomerase B [Variovorax sp. PBL-E5]|uniref:ribose 5-phosphate isomerase B n=1 Tax=Variovorax sp. PBL-E5 TaxID=434014 RepID=UPI001317013B|nr:ribose 5-phosphate isomerase B [Variovorax sp. PBL-E5]VTU30195.1 Putative sugar phosphate isomerase YwlF [Variovorax sp. PBL-E5]
MERAIAIANDHAGYDLKLALKAELESEGWRVLDLGCHDKTPVDYPAYGRLMGEAIREGRTQLGVLVCGSGIGISIAANRNPLVRAALVHDTLTARLAREHNDANVLCLGGQTTGPAVAIECLKVFLATPFGEGRHAPRVRMLGA